MTDRSVQFLPEDPNAQTRNFILAAMQLRAKPEEFIKLFHEDAILHMVGSQRDQSFYGTHRGHAEILRVLRDVDANMDRRYHQLLGVVIEGECFAVRRLVEMRHHGTAIVADFVVGHLVRFRQGRIAEVIEFIDTASVKKFYGQ